MTDDHKKTMDREQDAKEQDAKIKHMNFWRWLLLGAKPKAAKQPRKPMDPRRKRKLRNAALAAAAVVVASLATWGAFFLVFIAWKGLKQFVINVGMATVVTAAAGATGAYVLTGKKQQDAKTNPS